MVHTTQRVAGILFILVLVWAMLLCMCGLSLKPVQEAAADLTKCPTTTDLRGWLQGWWWPEREEAAVLG